jgi:hypothetical protein
VYRNEIWALKIKDIITYINREEILQKTAGCTRFDHKRNAKISEGFKVEPVEEKL